MIYIEPFILEDGAWTRAESFGFWTADNAEAAWFFARGMLSPAPFPGMVSVHSVRDPLRAALTKEGLGAILRDSAPHGFASVDNPGVQVVMTEKTP